MVQSTRGSHSRADTKKMSPPTPAIMGPARTSGTRRAPPEPKGAAKSETRLANTPIPVKKLKTGSKKLLGKYPDRFYTSERYAPAEGAVTAPRAAKSAVLAPVPVIFRPLKARSAVETEKEVKMKQLSLTEQKKLQWAKEREEMNELWSPWGRPSTSGYPSGPQNTGFVEREALKEISAFRMNRQSPSPPPAGFGEYPRQRGSACLHQQQQTSSSAFNYNYYNVEDDHTSGYQSDSGHGRGSGGAGAYKPGQIPPEMSQSYDYNYNKQPSSSPTLPHAHRQLPASAMRSSFAIGTGISDVAYIEEMRERERAEWLRDLTAQMETKKSAASAERSRWGDRGICAGHFLESEFLVPGSAESNGGAAPPAWASRPVSMSKSHPNLLDTAGGASGRASGSPGGYYYDVYTMNQSMGDLRKSESATFLRGQNVPVDPEVFQEKERKRIAAQHHQQAILQQIEDRQQRLREERAARERQEVLDEQRIREQELKLLERAEREKRLKEQALHEHEMDDVSLQSLPIAVLRRQQFHPQNSEDVIEYHNVRALTSEAIQTEAVTLLPKSPAKEVGIQTEEEEAPRLKGKPAAAAARKGRDRDASAATATSSDERQIKGRPPKPRWGAGPPPRKPYLKQSEKDPLYAERMARINEKRQSWLEKKAEERVHQAAGAPGGSFESSEFSYSSDTRGRRQAPLSKSKAPSGVKNHREVKKAVERQKNQWKREQEKEEEEVDSEALILRRQSKYLDEEDLQQVVAPSAPAAAATQRPRDRSTSPTKIPVSTIRSRNRRTSEGGAAPPRARRSDLESTSEMEEPVKAPVVKKPKPKPQSRPPREPPAANSRSRSMPRQRPASVLDENANAPPPPQRSQSPPVPALMKQLQQGVAPEDFGKTQRKYEIPEKAGIDSTPPAPVPAPLPPPQRTVPPPEVFVVDVGERKPSQPPKARQSLEPPQEPEEEPEFSTPTPPEPEEETEDLQEAPETELSPTPPSEASGGYFAAYIPPAVSPRGYFLDTQGQGGSARPSTRDSEFSERRALISSVMSQDLVQEQIEAREEELEQNGIIEFSIHLPPLPMYAGGSPSLLLSTRIEGEEEERVLHCSQPSSVSPSEAEEGGGGESELDFPVSCHRYAAAAPAALGGGTKTYSAPLGYPYKDPMASARRRATIHWLYSNEEGRAFPSGARGSDPYILTRLSSLKKGIQSIQRQAEWSLRGGEEESSPSGGALQDPYAYRRSREAALEEHRRAQGRRGPLDSMIYEY